MGDDPVLKAAADAPIDDEPETESERAACAEFWEKYGDEVRGKADAIFRILVKVNDWDAETKAQLAALGVDASEWRDGYIGWPPNCRTLTNEERRAVELWETFTEEEKRAIEEFRNDQRREVRSSLARAHQRSHLRRAHPSRRAESDR